MLVLRTALTLILLVTACAAADEITVWQHEGPISHVKGKIVDQAGRPISGANIVVSIHPELWLDKSLSLRQMKERQQEVATTVTDEKGRFSLKRLPKGDYELEFSKGGFNTIYAIVTVDPSASSETFCVSLRVSDGNGEPAFRPCGKKTREEERIR